MNRDMYRALKNKSREEMTIWLYQYGVEHYFDGCRDKELTIYRQLVDKFGFTNEMLQQLKNGSDEDINCINERYISAKEIQDGLQAEGFTSVEVIKEEK